jgi:hypothetical protein
MNIYLTDRDRVKCPMNTPWIYRGLPSHHQTTRRFKIQTCDFKNSNNYDYYDCDYYKTPRERKEKPARTNSGVGPNNRSLHDY